MNFIIYFVDFFIHLDKYLPLIIQSFGVWAYVIIFLVIFCEIGLVVTPILYGDSLFIFSPIHLIRVTECTIL